MLEVLYCDFHQVVLFDKYAIVDNALFWNISPTIYRGDGPKYMTIDMDKKVVYLDLEIYRNCRLVERDLDYSTSPSNIYDANYELGFQDGYEKGIGYGKD